jgi:hypothetical protein
MPDFAGVEIAVFGRVFQYTPRQRHRVSGNIPGVLFSGTAALFFGVTVQRISRPPFRSALPSVVVA